MISSFSDAGYLMRCRPHSRSCFFKQTVLEGQVGNAFLQIARLPPQVFYFITGCGTGGITASRRLPASMNSFDQV